MRYLTTAMLLLLASCTDTPSNALHPTRDDKEFTMRVEIIDSDKITEKCTELGVQYESNGCASFNLDTKICTIYVMPLRSQDDTDRMTIIGHETWHCRYGNWHD